MGRTELTLQDYVLAGFPAIACNTSEERRALEECLKIARSAQSQLYIWSATKGIVKEKNGNQVPVKTNVSSYEDVLKEGLNLSKGDCAIFCLLDFHPFIKNPTVWRTAKDVFKEAKAEGITYIFISDNFEIPKELSHEILIFNMKLPNKSDFKTQIRGLLEDNFDSLSVSDSEIDVASNAALGLTLDEAENAYAIALAKKQKLDLDIIYDVKKQVICKENLLEYYYSTETLDTIGGMKEFKRYAMERSFSAFSEEAREYGLPYPKGVLLFGIPGCGKSLAAKALANMWHVPLIKLDLSKLFGSFVGDTETNTRKALEIAETMAPCIVWIDELDKAISGVGSSGKTDSGVTSRMFGTILTWLQEKESPVYVIATANNINLPPELLRKGRFDEIFFVDLPNLEERKEILGIQIAKFKRSKDDFDIEKLAKLSDGYNGAEIEEAIVAAMYHAWNDGKRPYNTSDIEMSMGKLTPASKGIMAETVNNLREWSKNHAIRNANDSPDSTPKASKKGRIVRSSQSMEESK